MKKTIILLAGIAIISACKKEETNTNNTNNNNTNNGQFVPPTENFWKINGVGNGQSMDAVQVNINGDQMGVSKPFSDLGYGYCSLRVFSDNYEKNFRDEVPEGGFKEYFISTTSTRYNDSIRVELDVQDGNSNTQGNYFYRAESGKVYISKKNGKLRYSSNGVYQMKGVKYPNMQDYSHSCTLEFSQEQSN